MSYTLFGLSSYHTGQSARRRVTDREHFFAQLEKRFETENIQLRFAANPTKMATDWGDEMDENPTGGIPPRSIVKNADGTTTITDFGMSPDGYLQKDIKVVKYSTVTRTVSKAVAARKLWDKFGDCAKAGPGLERGISTVSIDEIHMEWVNNDAQDEAEQEEEDFAKMAAKDIQGRLKMERFRRRQEERKRGVANWAQLMSLEAAQKNPTPGGGPPGVDTEGGTFGGGGGGGGGKYQPPAKRGGSAGLAVGESMNNRDDSATVRISNISGGTTEADLDELCKGFGNIRRIFLSRDRETGDSRGFAFVAFVNVSDAARCIDRLDGHGYDHLILQVEWSKPKEPKDGAAGGTRPTFGR